MKHLNQLSFAAYTSSRPTPVIARRAKLLALLEQQKKLVRDPTHQRVVHKWLIDAGGVKKRVEVKKRVRQWWRIESSGSLTLTVRYGARAIEFEKGKAAIVVADVQQLLSTFDVLIAAVNAGELDDHLARYAKQRSVRKSERNA